MFVLFYWNGIRKTEPFVQKFKYFFSHRTIKTSFDLIVVIKRRIPTKRFYRWGWAKASLVTGEFGGGASASVKSYVSVCNIIITMSSAVYASTSNFWRKKVERRENLRQKSPKESGKKSKSGNLLGLILPFCYWQVRDATFKINFWSCARTNTAKSESIILTWITLPDVDFITRMATYSKAWAYLCIC